MPCFDGAKVAIINNSTKLCVKNNENGETKPCFSINLRLIRIVSLPCHRMAFSVPMMLPSRAPSHTIARNSFFITSRIMASASFISISLMRCSMMPLMSMSWRMRGRCSVMMTL